MQSVGSFAHSNVYVCARRSLQIHKTFSIFNSRTFVEKSSAG